MADQDMTNVTPTDQFNRDILTGERLAVEGARTVEDSVAMGVGRATAIVHEMGREIGRTSDEAAEDADRAAEAYRGAAEQTADQVTDLMSSYAVLIEGAQEFQRIFWEAFQTSLEMTASGPIELMRCKSMSDFAETQRELLRKGVDGWVETNRKLLAASGRIAEDAARPASGYYRA